MGNANPINEATQQRINDRLQEVLKTFAVEFSKAYTQVVIDKARSDLEPDTSIESQMKLEEAPVPSDPVKKGMLTKRGESVKNWKARFFVAYNAADNYKVEYYDGTSESGKLKGTIYCAGYSAYEFDKDDISEHGEPGIKLVPWSSRRRTWWIKCADDNERKEWLSVFQTACYKAEAPHDKDECIAEAFNIAIRNTRWQCWIWGWYWPAGDEAERLGELILDVLDRDILNEVIGGIVEGPAKALTIDLIRKSIGTTVKGACASAWTSSAAAVRGVSDKIQSTVKDLIGPILEKQVEFKNMIVDKISGKINPFLEEKGGALLRPVLNVVFKPVIRAFTEASKDFHKHIAGLIASGDFESSKFDSTLKRCDWQMEWWSGPVGESYRILDKMYYSDFAAIMNLFSGGLSGYTLYYMIIDKMRLILHRAVYTFGSLAKSVGPTELLAALGHTTSRLFHDCVLMIRTTMNAVLRAILNSPINEMVITPCKELIAPLQETIDSIPIPGLGALLDLQKMLLGAVDDIVDGSIDALVSGSISDINDSLNSARVELGVASLTV